MDVNHGLQNQKFNTNAESFEETQRKVANSLEIISKKMIKRIELLWSELKIPQADCTFYRNSLCSKCTLRSCQEMASYIVSLKEHRKRTIRVLYSISVREVTMSKVVELLSNRNSGYFEIEQNSNSGKRARFTMLMKDLQEATFDVVNAIRYWRLLLWRPMPFIYGNFSYVEKIENDLYYISHKINERVLSIELLNNWYLLSNINDERDYIEDIMYDTNVLNASGEIPLFNEPFTSLDKLKETAKYLQDESVLQRSLIIESKYLIKNNVFIPLIRHGNVNSQENSGVIEGSSVIIADNGNSNIDKLKPVSRPQSGKISNRPPSHRPSSHRSSNRSDSESPTQFLSRNSSNNNTKVASDPELRIELNEYEMRDNVLDKMSLVDKLRQEITGNESNEIRPSSSKSMSRKHSASKRQIP